MESGILNAEKIKDTSAKTVKVLDALYDFPNESLISCFPKLQCCPLFTQVIFKANSSRQGI